MLLSTRAVFGSSCICIPSTHNSTHPSYLLFPCFPRLAPPYSPSRNLPTSHLSQPASKPPPCPSPICQPPTPPRSCPFPFPFPQSSHFLLVSTRFPTPSLSLPHRSTHLPRSSPSPFPQSSHFLLVSTPFPTPSPIPFPSRPSSHTSCSSLYPLLPTLFRPLLSFPLPNPSSPLLLPVPPVSPKKRRKKERKKERSVQRPKKK